MTQVKIEVPARSQYVGVIRLALASLGRVIDLDDDRLEDLKTAVSEVCSNAVLAREEAREQAFVSIHWTEEPDRLIVDVLDPASQYADAPVEPTDSHGFSSRMVMSMALIETLVNECLIEANPDGGTRARLVVTR